MDWRVTDEACSGMSATELNDLLENPPQNPEITPPHLEDENTVLEIMGYHIQNKPQDIENTPPEDKEDVAANNSDDSPDIAKPVTAEQDSPDIAEPNKDAIPKPIDVKANMKTAIPKPIDGKANMGTEIKHTSGTATPNQDLS